MGDRKGQKDILFSNIPINITKDYLGLIMNYE